MHVKLPQVCSSSKYRQSEEGIWVLFGLLFMLSLQLLLIRFTKQSKTEMTQKEMEERLLQISKSMLTSSAKSDRKCMFVDSLIEYTCLFF